MLYTTPDSHGENVAPQNALKIGVKLGPLKTTIFRFIRGERELQ